MNQRKQRPLRIDEVTKKAVNAGMRLFEERGHEIKHFEGEIYLVPSESEEGKFYRVHYGRDHCNCPDYQINKKRDALCKHCFCVALFVTKHGPA